MHAHQWDPERFRSLIGLIKERTKLTDAELATLAGRSRPQINRWSRAENRPDFGSLRQLVTGLTDQHPTAADLAAQLLIASGYAEANLDQDVVWFNEPPDDLWKGLDWSTLDTTERIIWCLPDTLPSTRLRLMELYRFLEREVPAQVERIKRGEAGTDFQERRGANRA